MSDRELLELAAKAAGIELIWTFGGIPVNTPTVFKGLSSDETWNPLTDDGDALRLAVKLGLLGTPAHVLDFVAARGDDDPYAATRRAIVRAAAEIGRQMT